jgi:hypothetical protein
VRGARWESLFWLWLGGEDFAKWRGGRWRPPSLPPPSCPREMSSFGAAGKGLVRVGEELVNPAEKRQHFSALFLKVFLRLLRMS